ncbi:Appr-1-p processing protein, partial [Metalysinibacillus jejuensis]|uniref:Appr-1-p processing protein n=1 Tax=Metalysinibacillus jejuensis TaxID=914327 RepID=UPI000D3AC66F
LGCGNGGLDWRQVRPMIVEAFQTLDVTVHLYEPAGAPPLEEMLVRTKKPKMTLGRAQLLAAMSRYAGPGYRMSLLEVQKIAYFLYEIGALNRLHFEKHHYGPYAENLNHVLQALEGHYIRGYGDRTQGAEIYLLDGAAEEAENFLSHDGEALNNLQRVADLMYGFETPYDLELLSTVGWILKEQPSKANDKYFVVQSVQGWNERKKKIFPENHIIQVWDYLVNEVNFS